MVYPRGDAVIVNKKPKLHNMAVTSLRIDKDGVITHLMMMTAPTPAGVDIDVQLTDAEFMPVGKPSLSAMAKDEEEYHRELRTASHEKGHFVPEHSTNPEWNDHLTETVPHVEL